MITNFRHSGIVVQNLDTSIRFYEGLGFSLWKRAQEHPDFIEKLVGIRGAKVETAKLKSPCGSLLELLKYSPNKPIIKMTNQKSDKLGHSHISFTVSCLEKSIKYFKKYGGSIINKPQLSFNRDVKVLYCHDNEGNLIELVEEINI